GIWRSNNGDAYWTNVHLGGSGTSVITDPSNTSTMYASLEDYSFDNGFFRSTDGGATWSNIGTGLTGTSNKLRFDPSGSTLYAAGSSGIFNCQVHGPKVRQ